MVAEGKQRFMALFVFFPLPRSLRWKRKEPLSVMSRAGTLTLPHDLDSPLQLPSSAGRAEAVGSAGQGS